MDEHDARVRALGQRVLDAYGLRPGDVQSLTVELNAYGVPLVCVRLLLTDAALDAMQGHSKDAQASAVTRDGHEQAQP